MSVLEQYLNYLQRDDIEELVFQSDRPAVVNVTGQFRPLTRTPLSTSQIEKLMRSGPLATLLALERRDGTAQKRTIEHNSTTYVATLIRKGPTLQIRVHEQSHVPTKPAAPASQTPTEPHPVVSRPTPAPVQRSAPVQRPAPAQRPAAPSAPPLCDYDDDDDDGPLELSQLDFGGDDGGGSLQFETNTVAQSATREAATRPQPPAHSQTPSPAAPSEQARPQLAAPDSPRTSPQRTGPISSPAGTLSELLTRARQSVATDIHLVSNRPMALRRFGALRPAGEPISHDRVESLLEELLSDDHRERIKRLGYADFAFDVPRSGRFRANICRHQGGIKACFRAIAQQPPTIEELGLPPELATIADQHQGLAVISGPSGQGKTTTLAALVDRINQTKAIHIITVEDPVELVYPKARAIVNQREVGRHTNSFYSALKAALREDPDVIVIGELRDQETVEMALSAAETGHLVLATMSTPSGATTIDRLIDMFPPDEQSQVRATLAETLKMVISQRLLPTADGKGMAAACELISGNFALSNLIRENKLYQLPSLMQRGRGFGMIKLETSLTELYHANVITKEVAMHNADDKRLITEPGVAPGTTPPPAEPEAPPQKRSLGDLFGRSKS